MLIAQAEALAKSLMNEHGLHDWAFSMANTRRRIGECMVPFKHYAGRIRLSAPFVKINTEAAVRQIILHEIAHALVGPHRQHDEVFQAKCREIGGDPARLHDSAEGTKMPEGRYRAKCGNCEQTLFMFRNPFKRAYQCNVCGLDGGILKWTDTKAI